MENNEISIINGMPSLLAGTKLEFADQWPTVLELPSPFTAKKVIKQKVNAQYREHKLITACPHQTRKHYAKNMCKNCYIKKGREKLAWLCPHQKRPHYAKGQCQLCYLSRYNKVKKMNQMS